jgi:hypothetical protein
VAEREISGLNGIFGRLSGCGALPVVKMPFPVDIYCYAVAERTL